MFSTNNAFIQQCVLKLRKPKQQTNESGLFNSTDSPLEIEPLELTLNCSQFGDLADASKFAFMDKEYGGVTRGESKDSIPPAGWMGY